MKPECAITGVKTDSPHFCTGLAQHTPKTMKERPVRSLKEQKHPLMW
jgi:hypothetical protein